MTTKKSQRGSGGALGAGWRSGNRAEGLAIEMLRALAAVSPVPRSEDVGIDCVATLLVPDQREPKRLLAGSSFGVQVKSASESWITLSPRGRHFLLESSLPTFYLRVDLREARAWLYSSWWAHSHLREVGAGKAALFMGESEAMEAACSSLPSDWDLRVSLGGPILTFEVGQWSDDDYVLGRARLLEQWLALERHVAPLRHRGMSHGLKWEVDQAPEWFGTSYSQFGGDWRRDAMAAAPYLEVLGNHRGLPTEIRDAVETLKTWLHTEGLGPYEAIKVLAPWK